jgi:two-component system, NtrC family, response regulator HydG
MQYFNKGAKKNIIIYINDICCLMYIFVESIVAVCCILCCSETYKTKSATQVQPIIKIMKCLDANFKPTLECYEILLQTMSEAVLFADNNTVIQFCNQAAMKLTGYTKAELKGKSYGDLFFNPPDLSVKDTSNQEITIRTRDNKRISVLRNSSELLNSNNCSIGQVESLTDISELKIAKQKIKTLEINRDVNKSFPEIIGKSDSMLQVFEKIQLASETNANILLYGETGTGKELVAKALHNQSERKNRKMVIVNCSALTETLLESELFGHVKGSFTGAINDKIGRFELANKSTLFLDEIGEISPLIQLKLLRFLQEKEFERVGEGVTRRSNVRIISATNKDLWELVQNGKFREDLYYRLKVFPIYSPPLRDRKNDISLLIRYFVNKFNQEVNKNIIGLTENAMLMAMDYCWPGNVRELENAIEHAFVIRQEGVIDVFDLPVEIRQTIIQPKNCKRVTLSIPTPAPVGKGSQVIRSTKINKQSLLSVLNLFNGNISQTAAHLNVHRTTIWRLMKKFKIEVF